MQAFGALAAAAFVITVADGQGFSAAAASGLGARTTMRFADPSVADEFDYGAIVGEESIAALVGSVDQPSTELDGVNGVPGAFPTNSGTTEGVKVGFGGISFDPTRGKTNGAPAVITKINGAPAVLPPRLSLPGNVGSGSEPIGSTGGGAHRLPNFDGFTIENWVPMYPYNVSLRRRKGGAHFCGGALIGPRHVLTAAHCVARLASGDVRPDIVVGAVTADQTSGIGVEVFSTKKVILHPKYTSTHPDLAILELDRASATPPVGLPKSAQGGLRQGQVLTSMGWGRTSQSSGFSEAVIVIESKLVPWGACRQAVGRFVRRDQLCSGGDGTGSCVGDGGGPIVIKGKTRAEDVLVGIVGTHHSCGASKPDVDTKVAPFLDWIRSSIPAQEKSPQAIHSELQKEAQKKLNIRHELIPELAASDEDIAKAKKLKIPRDIVLPDVPLRAIRPNLHRNGL